MFELLIILGGVFAFVASLFDWQFVILRISIAIIFICYGTVSFPFPQQDRYKIGLAVGCVCFFASGLAATIGTSWWPLPIGLILGYGSVLLLPNR